MTMPQCNRGECPSYHSCAENSNLHVFTFRGHFRACLYCEFSGRRYKCEVRTIKSYTHQKVSFVKNKRKTKCKPDSDVLYRRCCGAKMQDALRPLEGRWKLMIMAQLLAGRAMRF